MKELFGDIECVGLIPYSMRCVCRYSVEDRRLFAESLSFFVSTQDEERVRENGLAEISIETKHGIFEKDGETESGTAVWVRCEKLRLPVCYSGTVHAKQFYPDEQQHVPYGVTVDAVSRFTFENGVLVSEQSEISTCKETYISAHTWNEENKNRYLAKLRRGKAEADIRNGTHMLFFVSPAGNLAQNHLVMELVIRYLANGGFLEDRESEMLFRYEKPLLRTSYMQETSPASGEFQPCTADLALEIIAHYDLRLLKRIYAYIDFETYPEYSMWISDALQKNKEKQPEGYLSMLRFLKEKGLDIPQ